MDPPTPPHLINILKKMEPWVVHSIAILRCALYFINAQHNESAFAWNVDGKRVEVGMHCTLAAGLTMKWQ